MSDDERVRELFFDACRYIDLIGASQLLAKHPQLVETRDEEGLTALHAACEQPDALASVHWLVAQAGANVNATDHMGRTPLLVACEEDAYDAAIYLVRTKKVDVELADEQGYTPLHMAAMSGNMELVKVLAKEGGATAKFNRQGRTPAESALNHGFIGIGRWLHNHAGKHLCPPTCGCQRFRDQ